MKVVNVHQRLMHASPERVGALIDATAAHCVLEHRIEMRAKGRAILTWSLAIRHLHDVCVEEVLSQAQVALGNQPKPVRWPLHVKFLHWLVTPRKRATASLRGEPRAN